MLHWQTTYGMIWAPSSEFVSSSIPSLQILTAHAQPFRGARDLAFCLKVPLDSLLVWASSEGSGETARMPRLAWTFAARIGDKYQIRLARPIWLMLNANPRIHSKFCCILSLNLHILSKIALHDGKRLFVWLGFTTREDYFTYFERSQSKGGAKKEIPEKKHLTTRKHTHMTGAMLEPIAVR